MELLGDGMSSGDANWDNRVSSLRRRSLGEEVAATLRNMILVGEILPDEKLTQEAVAKRLDVSTTPAREGLLKLASEGFIVASRNRAFRAVGSTREDVYDVYWAHAMLSGEIAARACQRSGRELLAVLRDAYAVWQEAVVSSRAEQMEAANWQFHRNINTAAAAPKLLLLLQTTLRFIPEHFYVLLPEWPPVSDRGHRSLLGAFEEHDPEAARAAAAQHVNEARDLLMAHFTDMGYWTRPADSRVT